MHTNELKAVVRDAYAGIDSSTEAVACKLYSPEELADVPRSAIEGLPHKNPNPISPSIMKHSFVLISTLLLCLPACPCRTIG
jgi:hypothetical protein